MEEVSGAVQPVTGHAVGFYDDDARTAEAVAPFLVEGLAAGEIVVVYVSTELRAELAAEIASSLGADALSGARADGRYREFDAEATLAQLVDDDGLRSDALARLRAGVLAPDGPDRVFGQMVDLLWTSGRVDLAIELEEVWNALARERRLLLRCAYRSPRVFDAHLAALGGLCRAHDLVLTAASSPVGASADGARQVVVTCLPVPEAVVTVRTIVRDSLARWRLDVAADDVVLVASELATNAVAHAGSGWRFGMSHDASVLRIEVGDAVVEPPIRRAPAPDAVGGRGVAIVEALADGWGSSPAADGKAVWAEFHLTR